MASNKSTSPFAAVRRGATPNTGGPRITRGMRDLYANASRADKAAMSRAFNNGTTTLAGLRRAIRDNNARNEPRRVQRATAVARRNQLAFDNAITSTTSQAQRARLRRDAEARGLDPRRGRAGLNAARANIG